MSGIEVVGGLVLGVLTWRSGRHAKKASKKVDPVSNGFAANTGAALARIEADIAALDEKFDTHLRDHAWNGTNRRKATG